MPACTRKASHRATIANANAGSKQDLHFKNTRPTQHQRHVGTNTASPLQIEQQVQAVVTTQNAKMVTQPRAKTDDMATGEAKITQIEEGASNQQNFQMPVIQYQAPPSVQGVTGPRALLKYPSSSAPVSAQSSIAFVQPEPIAFERPEPIAFRQPTAAIQLCIGLSADLRRGLRHEKKQLRQRQYRCELLASYYNALDTSTTRTVNERLDFPMQIEHHQLTAPRAIKRTDNVRESRTLKGLRPCWPSRHLSIHSPSKYSLYISSSGQTRVFNSCIKRHPVSKMSQGPGHFSKTHHLRQWT